MKRFIVLSLFVLLVAFGCLEQTGGYDVSTSEYALSPTEDYYGADSEYITKESYITIKVGEGTLETKFEELKNMLESDGAQLSNIDYNEYGNRKQYTIVVKVDPNKFDRINEELKTIGEVKDLSVSLEDVTEEYLDLEVRIKNREIELERLYELYNKSNDIEDLLAVEYEITRVETELELLKQQEQDLISEVERSTISITIYEEKSSVEQLTLPLENLGEIFFGALAVVITLIVGVLGFILPLAVIAAIVWFVYKKFGKKNLKKSKSRGGEHGQIPPPQ